MANELKEICSLLEGYRDDNRYEVLRALKDGDEWELTIRKVEPEEKDPKESADDNK